MSANTLTGLLPDHLCRRSNLPRWLASSHLSMSIPRPICAKDQDITHLVVGTMAASDATPASTLPDPDKGVTIGAGR
jgi:hypothetical protein